ncbi:MAG: WYL domain-containing protein [Campylobacter sp.]|nr:WYL domain-containing protein [Campylobacter sp.]
MSKISSTYRVIEILRDLQNGRVLSIKNLASYYETSERSIRRDFELIAEIFGDILISPKKGEFAMIQKAVLENVLESSEIYMLKDILTFGKKYNLSLDKDIDERLKNTLLSPQMHSPYVFVHKPYEEIFTNKDKFKFLEQAIKSQKQIIFTYKNLDRITSFCLNPHKIVFINENFYLASLSKNENMILSRIAMMSDIKFSGKKFDKNYTFLDFCEKLTSPWARFLPDYKNKLIDVIIELPKAQAKYFKLKKFHPSQYIISEDEAGFVRVGFKVTSQNEIIPIIKSWIPYVNVIAPQNLVDIMRKISERFYDKTHGISRKNQQKLS